MASGLPRTRFDSSGLVRLLAELVSPDAPDPKQSFAERLAQWLAFNDALSLYSALNAGTGGAPQAPSGDGSAARQAYARVRDALADGIAGEGRGRIELPRPAPEDTAERAADFAPYHRFYVAHQRNMSATIGPLRASLRTTLSRRSAGLKRLALLDAVLDQALAAREAALLGTVPTLLARRFEALYTAHQAALAETAQADDPQAWTAPGGWLAAFCRDLRAVLRAELALRLQPAAGLVAALDNEIRGSNE